jgi:hypothetical protein
MTDWASLRDAYGSAEQVPALLAAAEQAGTSDGSAWDDLWGRLCHQGTVYSASYAALPALATMCLRHTAGGYSPALYLTAAVIASTDGPEDPASVRRRYAREIADLRPVATAYVRHAADDTDFIYRLEVLMAFEDAGVWQRNLHHLANGELSAPCPSCDEDLLVDFDGSPVTVASFADGSRAGTAVAPAEPAAGTVEDRLLTLARVNDRPAIADTLPYLFGAAICPCCHVPFLVRQALV